MRLVVRAALTLAVVAMTLTRVDPASARPRPAAKGRSLARAESDAVKEAQRLKSEANQLLDGGRAEEALERYRQARAASPLPELDYNEGRALQALARYGEALESLTRFRDTAPPKLVQQVPTLDALIAELRAKLHVLTVVASPEGAEVLVRDVRVGQAPLRALQVAAGEAKVEVRAPKHAPYVRTVELAGGATSTLEVTLAPVIVPSYLAVVSSPEGARVAVDGRVVGASPTRVRIEPGRHDVTLELDGYERASQSIAIKPEASETLRISLTKRPGGVLTRWWFWGAVGVVAAGATASAIALTTERDPAVGSLPPGQVAVGR